MGPRTYLKILVFSLCGVISTTSAQGLRAADVLAETGRPIRDPAVRQQAVKKIAQSEVERRVAAEGRARRLGLPVRGSKPGGGAFELADFDGDTPLYLTTCNANAAISSGANLLQGAPYGADGSGGTVGVWDACSALITHQEFGGRVTTMDGAAVTYDHSTHVAGTVCAAGVDAAAKGMAPAVRVDSYDWNSDASEMAARGASYPGESGMINISSHSYGANSGWVYTGTPLYTWYGAGTTAAGVEDNFGQYNTYARDVDALASSLPYYLIFWAAGNDRGDNPADGNSVALSAAGTAVTYNSTLHPPGDRVYKGGYDTVGYSALGKNVLTVGAVTDAVSGGLRSVGSAAMTSFSSWGPTDDGRIKPDVVADGYSLKSSSYAGDASYSYMSGTSMATPNASGSSQLLVHWFGVLFTNQVMRASTLKALLVHTADDKGSAGPDYEYGWGLINVKAAGDLLYAYRTNAGTMRVTEDRVATNRTSVSISFAWDGVSPIRATLCWTDPAGPYTTSHDSRTPRLVNNLDLRVIGPDAAAHEPWVMPFVGDWSVASCAYAATAGSNFTDNVEQVLIASPGTAGTYTARVTFAGTLTNGSQPFSLILDGMAAAQKAPGPSLSSSTPVSGSGVLPFTITGSHIMLGATVSLRRLDRKVQGANVEVLGDTVEARFDTAGMPGGWWRMALTNPDGQEAVLWNAFAVPGPFWEEDFETNDITAKGWSFLSDIGTSQWALSMVKSVSPTRSVYTPGAATRSDTSVASPTLAIPSDASGLRLSFWHDFNLEVNNDGGVLEFSLDGGAWYDVTASGSGASFASNGYNATISSAGAVSTRNPLAGRNGWSGNSGGFVRVVIDLADTAKYAGHTLRLRWRLGTNSSTASAGWYVEDISLDGIGTPPPVPLQGTLIRTF